eukprot:815865-Amphidinium_carterae.1
MEPRMVSLLAKQPHKAHQKMGGKQIRGEPTTTKDRRTGEVASDWTSPMAGTANTATYTTLDASRSALHAN